MSNAAPQSPSPPASDPGSEWTLAPREDPQAVSAPAEPAETVVDEAPVLVDAVVSTTEPAAPPAESAGEEAPTIDKNVTLNPGGAASSSPEVKPSKEKKKARKHKGDESDSDKEDDKEEEEKEEPPFTEQRERHLLNYQLWDKKRHEWRPFNPSTYISPPPPVKDLDNYFYANVRYDKPGAEPKLVLSNWSDTLRDFMRRFVGDNFFYGNPMRDVVDFFEDVHQLNAELRKAVDASKSEEGTDEEKVAEAKSLGYDGEGDGEEAREYLGRLVEHLGVFMQYLNEQYRPIEDKVALQSSYGRIEWELLAHFFKIGDHVTFEPICGPYEDETRIIGVEVQSRRYERDCQIPYFKIKGFGYMWDGNDYTKYKVSRKIPIYRGTVEVDSLVCKHITPEVKAELQERGRLYTSLSGVHYRTYRGDRVIVDRLAYNNTSGYTRDPEHVIPELEEDRMHLLPSVIYGFNLRSKSWKCFDVSGIRSVVFDETAWDHLVLDPETKTLIKALVRVTQNVNTSKKIVSDVISGKGGGLIAVLHGPPGTGKTLTAESVAELLKRPLYVVGSLELSTEPSALESNLKSILSHATAWDAVLLIDEADVFLEQRSLHEIERNALVSVALRVLEYHRGVLFLTTNRIKTFDEAFLSRFSIAIKYPELDVAGRAAVWRKFFELAGCVVPIRGDSTPTSSTTSLASPEQPVITQEELNELALKPFNGRTIKNLVRTAQALALSSDERLDIGHVRIVLKAQERFLEDFASITAESK